MFKVAIIAADRGAFVRTAPLLIERGRSGKRFHA